MRDWSRLIRRHLPDLSADPTREAEILEEIRQHLEDRYQAALRSGLGEDEALEDV